MRVHTTAVIAEKRLGHEGCSLAVLLSYIAHDVFVEHHIVRGLHERVESLIDLALTRRRHFVMVTFDGDSTLLHGVHHLCAKVLIMVRWWNRKITFFIAGPVT